MLQFKKLYLRHLKVHNVPPEAYTMGVGSPIGYAIFRKCELKKNQLFLCPLLLTMTMSLHPTNLKNHIVYYIKIEIFNKTFILQ